MVSRPDDKKVVLLIMPALYAGGAEKQYRYIMGEISDKYNVKVLLLNRPSNENKQVTDMFIRNNKSIDFYQLNGRVFNLKNKSKINTIFSKLEAMFFQFVWLKQYWKNNSIDAVMFTYVTQLITTPLFKRKKTKVIFNERNTGRQVCDSKLKIWLLEMCDKVISNSKYAADYIKERTGIKVAVVNNGIERISVRKIPHKGFNIVVPARITPIKNQLTVVNAARFLPKDIHIILAGAIEDAPYVEKINTIIEENKLNVTMPGNITDLRELYGLTDIMCLPSYEEGTPNVLLEAYMFHIFPLVSNIPMNHDCCTDERILFDPNNPEELAQLILKAKNRTIIDDIDTFLDNNEEYMANNYSMERMRSEYLALLDDLLGKGEVI